MKMYLFILSFLFCGMSYSQNAVTGTVKDFNNKPISGANVTVVGVSNGTISDSDGKFILNTTKKPPFMVEISNVGFATQKVSVSSINQKLNVQLMQEETKLNEIVVSASRTPERVIESPVTIERMGQMEIKNTTSSTFYDGLENLKEVHFNTSSLSFKSINTRGFSTVANTRFMQLVDGMDNSSPALNFVLGNLIGLSDIDVANVELLPGASSALYGANAFNGILFMNSKSPFTKQGITTYVKYGKTNQETAGMNDFWDAGIRVAKVITPRFAAKANFTFMKGTEWIAADQRSLTGGSIGHAKNQNYDGLNLYGDEVTTFISKVGQVSRTGYREQDLTDNKIESVKADFSLHFKPFANDFEIILQHKLGFGNTIYQGANRYALKNFYMAQTKLEVKGKNFFARVYMTSEDAGDSYNMGFAAWNVNRAAKSDKEWFTNYATAYQLSGAVLGTDANVSATNARQFADYNILPAGLQGFPQFAIAPTGKPRFEPNTPEFKNALASVISIPNFTEGAKFQDKSKLYHTDLNYNFKDLIQFADIQVGGSGRRYEMNSNGTIFTDFSGPLKYDEYGAYTQLSKKFLAEERLKFTGSVRYDKSQNFKGFVSPRVAFVYSAGATKKHNFRISYQTGFRNPTTQDQYIGLDVGPFALIGSAPDNLLRFVETRKISQASRENDVNLPAEVILNGNDAYGQTYTYVSVQDYNNTLRNGETQEVAQSKLQITKTNLVKPERVQAIELGYRTVVNNDLSIDLNGYYNIYNDFLNQARVLKPYYGSVGTDFNDPEIAKSLEAIKYEDRRIYQVYTNSKAPVTSIGFGFGLSKRVYKNFEFGVNYNYADFKFDQAKDPAFIPGFNTPKHRVKASLGNTALFKNFGFNYNVRWSDKYLWQSSFADGIVDANIVMDAQINYSVPTMKSVFKIGATNLLGKDYVQVIGAGSIGQQMFMSWTINP